MKETKIEDENNTYLSDWFDDKIMDDQFLKFVSEKDYFAYKKLKEALKKYQIEQNTDFDEKFNNIKSKCQKGQNRKKVRVIRFFKYSSAAVFLIAFYTLYQLYYFSNIHQTAFGEKKTLFLPDNSRVVINSKTHITYPNGFVYNRSLKMDGEAFFEVKKGSDFEVISPLGIVRVVGTKFNVVSIKDYYEVSCYEGKVKVILSNKEINLTKGEKVRFNKGNVENWVSKTNLKPSWIKGESSFENVSFKYVLENFERQYNIKIEYPQSKSEIKFTGSFTHKNINKALKSICLPLNLNFLLIEKRKVVILE